MAELQLKDVRKSFGAVEVIKGVSLEVKSGEFMVFVGPSGCGKSTLLRMIAGLERITGGTLEIDGQVVNDVPPFAVVAGVPARFLNWRPGTEKLREGSREPGL